MTLKTKLLSLIVVSAIAPFFAIVLFIPLWIEANVASRPLLLNANMRTYAHKIAQDFEKTHEFRSVLPQSAAKELFLQMPLWRRFLFGYPGFLGSDPDKISFHLLVLNESNQIIYSDLPELGLETQNSAAHILERAQSLFPEAYMSLEKIAGDVPYTYLAIYENLEENSNVPPPWLLGFGLVLGILVISGLVSSLIIGRTAGAIKRLQFGAQRIAEGNLQGNIDVRGSDEISQLSRDFEEMRKALEESTARRSRFLMSVSHDLKTPLTSLKGYLEALDDGLAVSAEERKQYIRILRAKSETLEHRIQELIDFARIETREWRKNLEDLDLRDFLLDFCSLVQDETRVNGRKFSYEVDLPSASLVKADPRLFTRALENLVNNAYNHGGPGVSLRLGAFKKNDLYSIRIEDNGPGISEADRKYIFDDFYRGGRQSGHDGLGLGLSIVRSVIVAHGWKLEARPSDLGGACLEITLR